jgi:ribosomal protein L11 methyltransferase
VVRIEVPLDDADVAADALWEAGASAVGEASGHGVVVLTADLDRCPPALQLWPHVVEEDDGGWWDGWRPFARAATVGPFVVRPPWVDALVPDGAVELVVDAGRAFGTGSHPSTTLALAALVRLLASEPRPPSVLDVGCGSGTLAIGAALLGAATVVAVDTDPAAVDATRANAERNGVADRIDVRLGAVAGVRPATFDVVVANLGAPLVFDLAPDLTAASRSDDGILVLSGLLGHHDDRIRAAYPRHVAIATAEEDGWTCTTLSHRRRESANVASG